MYKDKEKQREANRQAMRRNRAKGITEKVSHNQGITEQEFISEVAKIFDVPERTERGNPESEGCFGFATEKGICYEQAQTTYRGTDTGHSTAQGVRTGWQCHRAAQLR